MQRWVRSAPVLFLLTTFTAYLITGVLGRMMKRRQSLNAMTPEIASSARATHSSRATLVVLLVGQLMALIDVTIVNVAMPTIGTRLHASGTQLQLLVVGYIISYAVLLITGSRLGSVYGHRRLYMAGVSAFTLASLLCGLAPDANVLLATRFIQGAGAAAMVPQIISILQVSFAGRARAVALSAYAGVLASGFVIGQVLGGILVTGDLFGTSWRPIFLVNVPLGIVIVALAPRMLPGDTPTAAGRGQFDLAGLSISATAIFAIILPLVIGHQLGWPLWTRALIALGAILTVGFVIFERRVKTAPLLPTQVIRAAGFGTGLASVAFMMTAYGSLLFTLSIYLQTFLHYSALHTAATFAPSAAIFGFCGLAWNKFPVRYHNALASVGLAAAAIGTAALAFMLDQGATAFTIGALLSIYGCGSGLGFSLLLTRALANVPPTNAADASGLLTTTIQLFQSVGVATLGTLFLDQSVSRPEWAVVTATGWAAFLSAIGAISAMVVIRASSPRAAR